MAKIYIIYGDLLMQKKIVRVILLFVLGIICLLAFSSCDACSFGHYYDRVVEVEPTCTVEGSGKMICNQCGDVSKEISISPTGHSVGDSWNIVKEATCTESGMEEKVCQNCYVVVETRYISQLSHTSSDWIVLNEVTCTTDGKRIKECTLCKTTLEEDISKGAHQLVSTDRKAPTCTEKGRTEGSYCSKCDYVFKKAEDIKALGHTWATQSKKEATCLAEGHEAGEKCVTCNAWKDGYRKIDKLPHITEIIPAVAATCTSEGKTQGERCSVCRTILVAQKKTNVLSHSFEVTTNKCRDCSKTQYTECKTLSAFKAWESDGDTTFYLDSILNGNDQYWFITVKSNVKNIRFIGTPEKLYKVRIKIEARNSDFNIELVNATLTSYLGTVTSTSDVDINISMYGDSCGILSEKPETAANGKDGSNGLEAIKAVGSVKLNVYCAKTTIRGADGGDGGKGDESWGHDAEDGGDGGNGAYAINAKSITVALKNGISKQSVSIVGGSAGKGGKGGKAYSMIGVGSSLLYDNGKDGADGAYALEANTNIIYKN